MNPEYPLPGDTLKVLKRFELSQCQNPGLLFARFVPDLRADKEVRRREGLENVRKAAPDGKLLEGFRQRWQELVAAFQGEIFEATTEWRLIVGLGQKGPLEVGFTFHRLYGIPIIPGSALKGLARAYAYLVERRGESDIDFCDIFGRAPKLEETSQAGKAIFFDAIPLSQPQFDLDIMNPHYPKYYQGDEPPTDWQSPVPIYFLALKPGSCFAFAVGWRGLLDSEGQRLRSLAVKWLKAGLEELGAGAKTSAGYGYFYFISPPQPAQPADATSQLVRTSQTIQPAPATSVAAPTSVPSQSLMPSEELIWRTGTVREYQPGLGRGRLVDDETGEELRFDRNAITEKGWSPGKKHKVRYAVAQREGRVMVVKIQQAR
ncbi:MAG: type III-B CRISPR module RAMP protein Cmr6 [Anaerolineae bacterium]|nr:type III-B CRISPR module RAMP protein Cmr6 [Anaerolineae bacterium]MDW8099256.1 type III-B CRISPR module RAMP protein Cmr6 [Anaerolineae bacterium]